jgi:hypothetical protein
VSQNEPLRGHAGRYCGELRGSGFRSSGYPVTHRDSHDPRATPGPRPPSHETPCSEKQSTSQQFQRIIMKRKVRKIARKYSFCVVSCGGSGFARACTRHWSMIPGQSLLHLKLLAMRSSPRRSVFAKLHENVGFRKMTRKCSFFAKIASNCKGLATRKAMDSPLGSCQCNVPCLVPNVQVVHHIQGSLS